MVTKVFQDRSNVHCRCKNKSLPLELHGDHSYSVVLIMSNDTEFGLECNLQVKCTL